MTNFNNYKNELKIGVTVLIAIIIAFTGYSIMRDQSFFSNTITLYTKYGDVTDLNPGSQVLIKGYKVGKVIEMTLEPTDSTLVGMQIDRKNEIPAGSTVYLKSPGLLGDKYLEIVRNPASSAILDNGDFIEGVYTRDLFDTIGEKGTDLANEISSSISGIEQLVDGLNETLNSENKENIAVILKEFSQLSQDLTSILEGKKEEIDAITGDVRKVMSSMKELSHDKKDELDKMISQLEASSKNLEELTDKLNEGSSSLNNILYKIEAGEGSLGKLVNDANLYNNLDTLTVKLSDFIDDVQANPKKYLKYMRLIDIF